MKKNLLLIIGLCLCVGLSAQSSLTKANRKTAERCLSLAENCLASNDLLNAKKQAELGLSYDETISDFYYILAAVQSSEGEPKLNIIETVSKAFEIDNWISYSKNNARILLADLLCDTGFYEKSLEILDEEPFIYSADAEFIRIKNYYCIGSEKALETARLKINSTRRIYPLDERFPNLFFLFEANFKYNSEKCGLKYQIPDTVQAVVDSYILHLPDYEKNITELELLASFLVENDVQDRLVNSILAKESEGTPLMAIAALNAGVFSAEEAFNMYFETCQNSIQLTQLQFLISKIKDRQVMELIAAKLDEFDGYLYVDEDLNLQNELCIKYDCGRPLYISYDKNNDGEEDIYAVCDLGTPLSVVYKKYDVELFYNEYPFVQKINYLKEDYTYDFVKGDYFFTPFEIIQDDVCASLGTSFYIAYINKEAVLPSPIEILEKASSISFKTSERENSKIVYSSYNGNLAYANFFDSNRKYAYCSFEDGFPFIRYIDYNNDDSLETVEIYDVLPTSFLEDSEMTEESVESLYDKNYIDKIFGNAFDDVKLYLKKIQIDRDSDTIPEFTEEYLPFDGRINMWDFDDNGIIDNQYIKYPKKEDESLIEENIFFDEMGMETVRLTMTDGKPSKIKTENDEIDVIPSAKENFYWIGKPADLSENEILENVKGMGQGAVDIIQVNGCRVNIIKVGADYFCKFLDVVFDEDSEVELVDF